MRHTVPDPPEATWRMPRGTACRQRRSRRPRANERAARTSCHLCKARGTLGAREGSSADAPSRRVPRAETEAPRTFFQCSGCMKEFICVKPKNNL